MGFDYWRVCAISGLDSNIISNNYRTFITGVSKDGDFFLKSVNNFDNASAFADAMCATSFIPLFLNNELTTHCDGERCLDGGVSFSHDLYSEKFQDGAKLLDITFNSTYENDCIEKKIHTIPIVSKGTYFPLIGVFFSLFTHANAETSDETYEQGYADGLKILPKILKQYDLYKNG